MQFACEKELWYETEHAASLAYAINLSNANTARQPAVQSINHNQPKMSVTKVWRWTWKSFFRLSLCLSLPKERPTAHYPTLLLASVSTLSLLSKSPTLLVPEKKKNYPSRCEPSQPSSDDWQMFQGPRPFAAGPPSNSFSFYFTF
jgi:hypothetical protein